jgi:hypothetical protein
MVRVTLAPPEVIDEFANVLDEVVAGLPAPVE